jgi:hypothetical protein
MENDPQMYQTTYIGHHTCKDTLKAPQIIMESDPNWESYIINPDSMWGKQADHALSSSSPTIKQESKEDTLSDLTDNLSSLGTNYLWSDLKAFELSDPAIMSPKLGSDNGDVVSTMYSCTDTGFDLDFVVKSGRFDSDFNFDESEFI